MKSFSLLKAALSQDMNMFKYSAKRNSSKLKKILFPVILFIIVGFSIGTYAYLIAEQLAPLHLTYIMLSMFIMLVTILTFIEGIYKSQGILFEAKDNDLLFSLPIKKSQILFVRIFKLLLFQYLYNLMFLLPAFVIYVYFERPGIYFYLISFLMTIVIPIIPTIISSTLGYVIKLISSKFKAKKIFQTILSSFVFLIIFFFSLNLENFISNIAVHATSINALLTKIYYPSGLYINLINSFSFFGLLKLISINILPFILFITMGQKYYFKIISNSNDKKNYTLNKQVKITKHNKINALVRKELKRYFSSVVYMFNTSFGLIICLVGTIFLAIKGKDVLNIVIEQYNISSSLSLSILYYFFILFVGSMTSISSSSISLEGKSINITKSLPVKEQDILHAKILTCYAIEMPFILISTLIFAIRFKPTLLHLLLIVSLSLIIVLLNACIGLIVNLKYPKMNASSDTEVVKQSMSSMICNFLGMGIFFGSIILAVILSKSLSINIIIIIHCLLLAIISIFSYVILMNFGKKAYRNINV